MSEGEDELPVARALKVGEPRLAAPPRVVPRKLAAAILCASPIFVVACTLVLGGFACLAVYFGLRLTHPLVASAHVVAVADSHETDSDGDALRDVTVSFVDRTGAPRMATARTSFDIARDEVRDILYAADDPTDISLEDPATFVITFGLGGLSGLAGFGIAILAIVRGRRAVHLLRYGIETTGKLVDHHEPAEEYARLTFAYVAGERTYQYRITIADPSQLVDDDAEPMVYDPRDPTRATTLDHLPGHPKIVGGRYVARAAYAPFLIPVTTILVAIVVGAMAFHVLRA